MLVEEKITRALKRVNVLIAQEYGHVKDGPVKVYVNSLILIEGLGPKLDVRIGTEKANLINHIEIYFGDWFEALSVKELAIFIFGYILKSVEEN